MKNYHITIFLIFSNYISVFAQNYTFIAGKIINHDTRLPVAGVYVGIPAKGAIPSALGVVTNESGEFILKYPILLQATGGLNITKIDYKEIKRSLIEFKDKKDSLIFEIQVAENKLIETRDGRKTIDYVISRLEKNYNVNPYNLTGFYRESLKIDSGFVRTAEGVLKEIGRAHV